MNKMELYEASIKDEMEGFLYDFEKITPENPRWVEMDLWSDGMLLTDDEVKEYNHITKRCQELLTLVEERQELLCDWIRGDKELPCALEMLVKYNISLEVYNKIAACRLKEMAAKKEEKHDQPTHLQGLLDSSLQAHIQAHIQDTYKHHWRYLNGLWIPPEDQQ